MDAFAQIAKSGVGGRLEKLIIPEPILQDAPTIMLSAASEAEPYTPLQRISTPEQLTQALKNAREQYAPFLRSLAPAIEPTRTKIPITEFDWNIKGDPNVQRVTIPHYGSPVGAAETCYQTTFELESISEGKHVFVCFEGADYKARVFVNGEFAGTHEGFFAKFSFDITSLVKTGTNTLKVDLLNDFVMIGNVTESSDKRLYGDKIYAATGPGYDDPELGWHHCPPAMGLFDDVFIEITETVFVNNIFTRTLEDKVEAWVELYSCVHEYQTVELDVSLYGENMEQTVFEHRRIIPTTEKEIGVGDTFTKVQAARENKLNEVLPLPCGKGRNVYKFSFPLQDLHWWSLESPYLYQLQVSVIDKQGKILDTHCQNFGVRTFTQDLKSNPKGMFYLNGEKIRLRGANTMGFEQQDVMRNDFDQLIDDLLLAKLCNMNFLRLTQRPVQQEVYEYCNKLGLMTQTDFPLFGCLRRHQFCEAVRQVEEMERHIRSHPCNVIISYINEPFPNAFNLPNINLERDELERFFDAADLVVRLNNPDRVIKHIDGDYDPPSKTLPDNHCYPMWYNGHGIDIGRLHKGYWMYVMPDWYYGCGEFGAEGLEDAKLMMQEYPESWLPQKNGDTYTWTPGQIEYAQTEGFYHFFFDRQDSLEEWIAASQAHQAFATRIMTEAFRRDRRMVTFAIHLFIDAFPAGWMKTIMDCYRTPKLAYFAYRNALSPILISLRSDRLAHTAGDTICVESWLCNDTNVVGAGYELTYSLYCDGTLTHRETQDAALRACDSYSCATISAPLPDLGKRYTAILQATLKKDGNIVSENELEIPVLLPAKIPSNILVKSIENINDSDWMHAENGGILFIDVPDCGEHVVAGSPISVKVSGMSPMHFASRKTEHPWVASFEPNDFRLWYSRDEDQITPLAACTFTGDGFTPVLASRNFNDKGEWSPAMLLGEKKYGKGRIVVSQISYSQIAENPAGKLLLQEMK